MTGSEDDGPVTISWRHNGYPIENDSRISTLINGTLYIARVVHKPTKGRTDEGIYQCLATNRWGTVVSRRAELKIASKYWKSTTLSNQSIIRFVLCHSIATSQGDSELQSSFPAKSYTGATGITFGRETMFADYESP